MDIDLDMDFDDVEDYHNDDRLSPSSFGQQRQRQQRKSSRYSDVDVDVGGDDGNDEASITSSDTNSDDGDVNINDGDHYHDQLPSVEEIHNAVRMNAAAVLKKETFTVQNGRKNRNPGYRGRTRRSTIIIIVVVAAVIVGVGIGFASVSRHFKEQSAITFLTSDAGHGIKISRRDAFNDRKSPQSRALRWMLYDDPLELPLPTGHDDPFIQRYIIAVLMFALGVDGDTGDVNSSRPKELYQVLSASHECTWNGQFRRADEDHAIGSIKLGVLCDGNRVPSQTVTGISMPSSGLVGELPPELEGLTQLSQLVLHNNQIRFSTFTSATTEEEDHERRYALPRIPSLTYLSLSHNALSGTIPNDSYFSQMTLLETLSLSENALEGPLPPAMASLTGLRVLALDGNDLSGGISDVIHGSNAMTNLRELYLAYNSFEDRLSNDSFIQLSNLKVLDVKSNKLSGPLPDALWALTNLEVLDVHHNAFDGHINDVVKPGHKLKYMDVSENLLDKGIPPSMRHLTDLTHLDLSYNRFDQLLPGVSENGDTSFIFANMTKMETLLLTDNGMFGPQAIPTWVRRMKDLKRLSFRLTSRIGPIPTWLGELTKLELLDLDWNRLEGAVPTELAKLTRLKYLMLNRNNLTGEIPTEVASGLHRLKVFTLDNNDFSGTLDTCLGGMVLMVADCGNPDAGCPGPDCDTDTVEITCPCCTSCCDDYAIRCNMEDWGTTRAEHEFRGDYPKYSYNFDKVNYVRRRDE